MKTRAAMFRGHGIPLEVREVEVSEPQTGEVVVAIAAVGICGSDLHVVRGEWSRPLPMILGHEGAGIIARVGPGVTSVSPGEPVVLSWAPSCGSCAACKVGRPTACAALRDAINAGTLLDGTTRIKLDDQPVFRMTTVGALAEHVLLPEVATLRLPDHIPLEHGALLGCAALTGVGAVYNVANIEAGATVLVIGAGGVGQFIVQAARAAGASRIVAVDPNRERARQAARLGATATAHPRALPDVLHELLPGGADCVFEAVGTPDTQALALQAARTGGLAVLVGMAPAGSRIELDPAELVNREKILTGSVYGSGDPAASLAQVLELVARGELQLDPLVGPRFPLDRVNEALGAAERAPGRTLVTFAP